ETLLPDQIAGLAVERLDDSAGVIDEDRPVARQRRRLIGATLGHRRDPDQLQILCVVTSDLCQWAVVRREVIAANREPVARRRIFQHLVGDWCEVLHLARDRESGNWRLWLTASAPGPAAGSSSAPACGRRRLRRSGLCRCSSRSG